MKITKMITLIGLLVMMTLSTAFAQQPERAVTQKEKDAIEKAVKKSLIDPESARFEWPQLVVEPRADKPQYYCGYVNSRNRFGGYVGMQQYIVGLIVSETKIGSKTMGLHMAMPVGIPTGDKSDSIIAHLCTEHGYNQR